MKDASQHPDYPLSITRDEERAGFESLALFRLVDPDYEDQWTEVVGKVLGSSDVVLKISWYVGGSAYVHRRYGVMSDPAFGVIPGLPTWAAVGTPYQTPEEVCFASSIGASEIGHTEVIPSPAGIRRPEQGAAHRPG